MEITVFPKVRLRAGYPVWPVLLAAVAASLASATICPLGEQYWNRELERCVNCSRCDENGQRGYVVLRPCEIHRDTHCGPFFKLGLDPWWMAKKEEPTRQHHNRHHHKKKDHHRVVEDQKIKWRFGDDVVRLDDIEDVTATIEEEVLRPLEQFASTTEEVSVSGADVLVWDWQAVVLTAAVLACIFFFLLAALYSFHQARQWRRLKENFEADVEELSARLNLMVASGEIADSLEPNMAPITDGNYLQNHCVYLEQLLVRKDKKRNSEPGNVYIEESNANSTKA